MQFTVYNAPNNKCLLFCQKRLIMPALIKFEYISINNIAEYIQLHCTLHTSSNR